MYNNYKWICGYEIKSVRRKLRHYIKIMAKTCRILMASVCAIMCYVIIRKSAWVNVLPVGKIV